MGMNRLLHHTKKNGVGIVQGWCECIDEGLHPCKILIDLLQLTPTEVSVWELTGKWPWDTEEVNNVNNNIKKAKKNICYENQEIDLCMKMKNLSISTKNCGAANRIGRLIPEETRNISEELGNIIEESMEISESEGGRGAEYGGMGESEGGIPLNKYRQPLREENPELWTHILPPPPA